MKKKIYNQPQTEVSFVNTERIMSGVTVSINDGTDPNPAAGMPSRGMGIPD